MRILFIAPLPEPVTGHSLASKVLWDHLAVRHDLVEVNLSKKALTSGVGSWSRVTEVFGILRKVWGARRTADLIYLTISESVAGNLKDLAIYLICAGRLDRMVLHLHGGTIGKALFDRYPLLRAVNRYFISRMGAVIILGESHATIFEGMIRRERIHIVPNFAEERFFADPAAIRKKYSAAAGLNVLFLSHLIEGKGHDDLLNAFFALSDAMRSRVSLNFAGDFESRLAAREFTKKAERAKEVNYHGVVGGEEKKRLLADAHLFCLPTALSEGQPISVLEAYASGCAVATSSCGGIPDIFNDGENGFLVVPGEPESIRRVLESCLDSIESLSPIGLRNNLTARARFTVAAFTRRMDDVLSEVLQ